MSFPFVVPLNDTPQPTPTGGPLSIIERANQTAPYAGGGGGGGASTISTFNQLYTSSIGTAAPVANDFGIIGNGTNLVFDMSAPTLSQVQFQLSTSIGIGGNVPQISVIDTGGGGYTMSLNGAGSANVLVSVSSLNVSSINGAAPGGSVPANLSVSTLNVAGLASVSSLSGTTGAPLTLDGRGQAINVAATAVNIAAAPTTISTLLVSSINGAAPGGAVPDPLTLSSLSVSSINNFAYQTSAVGTNFVNTLGNGINTSNSVIYTNGKFQVVQFDVGVSTILYGGAGPTQFKIPMVSNQISPGNWYWASGFTPMMTMVGLAAGEGYTGGVETLNLQMSGTNPQTLQVWGNFTDSNYQSNYRITLTGIAP